MTEHGGRPPWDQQPGDGTNPPGRPIYGEVPRYGYQQRSPQPSGSVPPDPAAPPYMPPYASQAATDPSYGNQPYPPTTPQPYAAQPHPGQPYQPQYGAQPYPTPAYGMPPTPVYPYAPWGRRVGAYLIDFLPAIVAQVVFYIGYTIWLITLVQRDAPAEELSDLTANTGWMLVGGVLLLAAFGWQIYNRWLVAGRTGQSLGKRVLKTKLLAEATGQPIGPLNACLRDICHILDAMAFYIGFLWPLWDDKRQTFADKIMKTVVPDASPPSDQAPRT
jgi:uncharacterized RDD family membrane protein YckC